MHIIKYDKNNNEFLLVKNNNNNSSLRINVLSRFMLENGKSLIIQHIGHTSYNSSPLYRQKILDMELSKPC